MNKININEMRDISTFEVIKEMGIGINLGNTFESKAAWIDKSGPHTVSAYETAWGSPQIIPEIIKGYAEEGFGVLRIPAAWSNLMSTDGKYTISEEYLNRVSEIINWTISAGMYAIVNLHWDNGWLNELPNDYTECMKKYTSIWEQICHSFGDYGDRLIFESQNEELGWSDVWNHWGGTEGKEKAYRYCNEINQRFTDIVRSSGKNNGKRHLLISGYRADLDMTCDPLFIMPKDPENRCAVSIHYYIPITFAILEGDVSWGKCAYSWGTEDERSLLYENMEKIKTTFADRGVPVIIGEYGCNKNKKDPESVRRYITAICEEALKREGICPILWDTACLHYDRNKNKMIDRSLIKSLTDIRKKYLSQT